MHERRIAASSTRRRRTRYPAKKFGGGLNWLSAHNSADHRRAGLSHNLACGLKTAAAIRVRAKSVCFRPVVVLLAAPLTVFLGSEARSQQTAASQEATTATIDNNGEDFTRPQTLFQLRNVFQTAPGSGSEPGTIRTVTTDSVILRSDVKIDLGQQWTLALRGDLPFVAKNAITADDPTGGYAAGLGDAFAQAALIKTIDARWAAGAGLRIVAPTGTNDLTGGTWQALPIVGARYMLPELSEGSFFTGLIRYAASFATVEAGAKSVSNLQFAPTLNINLPYRWFVTFYPSPDIRLNYGAPATGQTGRLFLPADVLVGRNVTKDLVVSLEVGVPVVNQYPVYDFKTVVRLNYSF